MYVISKTETRKLSWPPNVWCVLRILLINRLLWHQVYRPKGQQRYNRFYRYVGVEHLRHGCCADDS